MSPAWQPARRHRGLDEHHVRTERGERVGHLDSHDSAVEHDQPSGTDAAVVICRLVHGASAASPGDRWDSRRRSGCDHNGAPGLQHVIPDADAALAVQTTPVAPDEGGAAAVKPRELTGVVQIADDLIATGEDRSNVELARGRLRRALGRAAPRQAPARDAATPWRACSVVGALTANELCLDDRDRLPSLGELAGEHLPGGGRLRSRSRRMSATSSEPPRSVMGVETAVQPLTVQRTRPSRHRLRTWLTPTSRPTSRPHRTHVDLDALPEGHVVADLYAGRLGSGWDQAAAGLRSSLMTTSR